MPLFWFFATNWVCDSSCDYRGPKSSTRGKIDYKAVYVAKYQMIEH